MSTADYDVPAFRLVDIGDVDGDTWYTISCKQDVADWIRSHNKEFYYVHRGAAYAKFYSNTFDIHKKIYITLILKWAQ